jgi:protein-S-isoprenylcysteine O-methyltransferase Ste14
MLLSHSALLTYPWFILGAVWLAAAGSQKAVVERQSTPRRLLHSAMALLGFALLAHPWFHRGWLGTRLFPQGSAFFWAGFGITAAGALFAVWARLTLGSNWSGRPSLMAGHELVTSGPYALARHPIYTGLVLAALGTALAIGEWRSILGVVSIAFAFLAKIHDEERFMLRAFPEAYPRYRSRVKALIPGIL